MKIQNKFNHKFSFKLISNNKINHKHIKKYYHLKKNFYLNKKKINFRNFFNTYISSILSKTIIIILNLFREIISFKTKINN